MEPSAPASEACRNAPPRPAPRRCRPCRPATSDRLTTFRPEIWPASPTALGKAVRPRANGAEIQEVAVWPGPGQAPRRQGAPVLATATSTRSALPGSFEAVRQVPGEPGRKSERSAPTGWPTPCRKRVHRLGDLGALEPPLAHLAAQRAQPPQRTDGAVHQPPLAVAELPPRDRTVAAEPTKVAHDRDTLRVPITGPALRVRSEERRPGARRNPERRAMPGARGVTAGPTGPVDAAGGRAAR